MRQATGECVAVCPGDGCVLCPGHGADVPGQAQLRHVLSPSTSNSSKNPSLVQLPLPRHAVPVSARQVLHCFLLCLLQQPQDSLLSFCLKECWDICVMDRITISNNISILDSSYLACNGWQVHSPAPHEDTGLGILTTSTTSLTQERVSCRQNMLQTSLYPRQVPSSASIYLCCELLC